jgi:hypothetical protein
VTSSTAINQEYPMNKDLTVIIFNDMQSVFFSRKYKRGEGVIVFNATFNNISDISWWPAYWWRHQVMFTNKESDKWSYDSQRLQRSSVPLGTMTCQ